MNKVPIKLERDPILEATFELRFQPNVPSASDLLPGLLYPAFKDRFKTPERLPIADFPRQFFALNPELAYQPRVRLTGDKYSIFIGDKSTNVSCPKPYVGWKDFRQLLLEVLEQLQKADLISAVDRLSLKYVNLLESASLKDQYGHLRMSAKLGSYDLTEGLTAITSEIKEDGLVCLVEIKGGATATTPVIGRGGAMSKPLTGLFIAVDVINVTPGSFWNNKENLLDAIHLKEKQVFFNLLTSETTEKLGAIWE